MRILEVEYLGPPALGGVEAVVEALAHGLRARDHSVEIWCTDLKSFDGAGHESMSAVFEEVPVRRFRTRRWRPWLFDPHHLMWQGLGRALAEEARKGSLFHLHSFPSSHVWAALGALKHGGAAVVTPHHDIASLKRYLTLWRGRHFVGRLSRAARRYPQLRLAVHTRASKHYWTETIGWPAEQIRVIPNGVYLSEFDSVSAEELEAAGKLWPKHELRLLFVGRLARSKGVDILLRSLAKTRKGFLVIIGPDEGAKPELQKLVKEHSLENRIRFEPPPSRRMVCAAFRACDLFVLPSRYGENFGIAAIEAMAAAAPVIVSSSGGLPSLVKNGENGFIFESESVDSLSSALYQLSSTGQAERMRRAFGQAGRRVVESAYTWERVTEEYVSLFDAALRAAQSRKDT